MPRLGCFCFHSSCLRKEERYTVGLVVDDGAPCSASHAWNVVENTSFTVMPWGHRTRPPPSIWQSVSTQCRRNAQQVATAPPPTRPRLPKLPWTTVAPRPPLEIASTAVKFLHAYLHAQTSIKWKTMMKQYPRTQLYVPAQQG